MIIDKFKRRNCGIEGIVKVKGFAMSQIIKRQLNFLLFPGKVNNFMLIRPSKNNIMTWNAIIE